MTNTKRIFQKLDESDNIQYAVERFRDYGVIQGYNDQENYQSIAEDFQKKEQFKGIYLKRRFHTEKNHTDLLVGEKAPNPYIVEENDLKFSIKFEDHIDIGLFLDHRISREIIKDEAPNKTVLNLFAYTGSFSLYALAGGAKSVTTVDLSSNYIDWAKENFELNGKSIESPNEFWDMDVYEFIEMAIETNTKYDIIILDPPSFSRNKNEHFQVQRDHKDLIRTLQNKLLNQFGFIFFSTNLQTFKLDDYIRPGADKMTKSTIPEEFKPYKPHQSFVFYN